MILEGMFAFWQCISSKIKTMLIFFLTSKDLSGKLACYNLCSSNFVDCCKPWYSYHESWVDL